jgi:class 3 adenylate cyclase
MIQGTTDSTRAQVARGTWFFLDFKRYAEKIRFLEHTAGPEAAAELKRMVGQYVADGLRSLPESDYHLIDEAGDGFFFWVKNPYVSVQIAEALYTATAAHNAIVQDNIAKHSFRAGAATGIAAWVGPKPVGHTVNVGARLQAASLGGDLVVDPATFSQLVPDIQKRFNRKELIRSKNGESYEAYRLAFGAPQRKGPFLTFLNALFLQR